MDFLDPRKSRESRIRLIVGYILIAIAILLGTIVLLFLAYGYGIDRGKIIQNGLVFVSSHPGGANISLKSMPNGTVEPNGITDSRLTLPAGSYTMQLQRSGYRTWERVISVVGDNVERFDYPFLFPTTLTTTTVQP